MITTTKSGRASVMPHHLRDYELSNIAINTSNCYDVLNDDDEYNDTDDDVTTKYMLVGSGIGSGFSHTEELKPLKYEDAMKSDDKKKWQEPLGFPGSWLSPPLTRLSVAVTMLGITAEYFKLLLPTAYDPTLSPSDLMPCFVYSSMPHNVVVCFSNARPIKFFVNMSAVFSVDAIHFTFITSFQ
jgi:hypothetical protein